VILVDAPIWIDHLRMGDAALGIFLEAGSVVTHPIVIAEVALSPLSQRGLVLDALAGLPQARTASDLEALDFIGRYALGGLGLSYSDVHLLAAARLTLGAALWTRDARLHEIALQLGLAFAPRD
jgi:predicted nucleic acid-binding protein